MKDADSATRRLVFRRLHEEGCFVIPNPWDAGSARYMEMLGFRALATTSSGFAFTKGLPDADRAVPLEAMLGHIAEIAAATRLPVNADFKAGYAREPEDVARNVKRCIGTGVAGLSIEDSTEDAAAPLFEFPLAVERVRAARRAIDESGSGVMLTARAECFLTGHTDPLEESVRRLVAYAEAGADVLYAPGPREAHQIKTIVEAVRPRPVNVLVSSDIGMTVADLAAMGVRRISVGSALARAAWAGFLRAAETIVKDGSFRGLERGVPFGEINTAFSRYFEGL